MEEKERYTIAKQLALEWVCGGREPQIYFEHQMVRAITSVGQIAISRALEAMEEKPTSANTGMDEIAFLSYCQSTLNEFGSYNVEMVRKAINERVAQLRQT